MPYDQFVAPGLLATAAMNGAVFDTTFNFFFKYKYAQTFDAMLATPLGPTDIALGEMGWALLRGTIYSAAFLATMAALRARVVVVGDPLPARPRCSSGSRSPAPGMAATTFMRSFVDFDYVNMALDPAVPVLGDVLPAVAVPDRAAVDRPVHAAVPGRRARAVARARRVQLGDARATSSTSRVMGVVGLRIAGRRLARLLQP